MTPGDINSADTVTGSHTEAEHALNCEIHRLLVNTSSDVQVKSETEKKSRRIVRTKIL